MKKHTSSIFLVLFFLSQILVGCSHQPKTPIQPTPTLQETLSQRDAIRRMRSKVIAQVQIVDPFQVAVAQSEGVGDIYTISYLSPFPFGGEEFKSELQAVALQATEGYVLSELKLPYLLIFSTSVDALSGSRTISIDYESAYQWFTGQIDTDTYAAKWVEVK